MAGWISPYLIVIVAAWLSAHVVKYIIASIKGNRTDFIHQLFISGGMPSSHAAVSVSLLIVIALRDGTNTALFGLATLFTLIVCYDAVKVRRSSGEQGEAIAQLIKESDSKVRLPRAAKGHTPVEVAVGAVFGVLIGCIVFLATK